MVLKDFKPYLPSNTGGKNRGQKYTHKNISQKDSSKTFPGIAKAMAEQWSEFMLSGMTVDEWENKNNPQMKLYL